MQLKYIYAVKIYLFIKNNKWQTQMLSVTEQKQQ